MSEGISPGPDMAALNSMMANGGSGFSPGQSLLGLPAIDNVRLNLNPMKPWGTTSMFPIPMLASAQGDLKMGPFKFLSSLFQGMFVSMSDFSRSFVGEANISAPMIDAPHMPDVRIEGMPISAASVGMIDVQAPNIEAPKVHAPSRGTQRDIEIS